MSYPVSNAFWSAQSSWMQVVAAKQAAASALKRGTEGSMAPSKTLARKEALWKSRGAHYLRGRPDLAKWFKSDNSASFMVRVDPRLSRVLADIVDEINPAIVAAMDTHVAKLAFEAWREWPVQSGLSKSLIGLEYRADGDSFTGAVTNTTPYVFFIKGSPHRALLESPAAVVAFRIVRDVQSAIKVAAK